MSGYANNRGKRPWECPGGNVRLPFQRYDLHKKIKIINPWGPEPLDFPPMTPLIEPLATESILLGMRNMMGLVIKSGLLLHLYADDLQIYGFCASTATQALLDQVAACISVCLLYTSPSPRD